MRKLQWIILSVVFVTDTFAQHLSEHSFDSTIQIFKSSNDAESFTYTFVDQYLSKPDESGLQLFNRYEKELWRPLETKEEKLAYVILLCNKAYYQTRYAEIYNAIDTYEKAWKIFGSNQLRDFDIIEYCLQPLANNYSMLGDYTSAGNIIKNYLFLGEKENDKTLMVSAFINLAIIYHNTGKITEASDLLQRALILRTSDTKQKGLIYTNLALNYEGLKDIPKAKHYAHMALSVFRERSDSPVQLVNVYKIMAVLSIRENREDDALNYIIKAAHIAELYKNRFQNRELAKLNNSYAQILNLKQRYDEALKIYQNTLTILLPTYDAMKSANGLPEVSSLYAENTIKETFDGLASVYIKLNQPELALTCYELCFATEDLLRLAYNYEDAKLLQQLENRQRAERALAILYDLSKGKKHDEFVEKAFQIAERTKAVTLRENIDNRYEEYKINSDSLLESEHALRYKHAKISNDIVLEQMKHENADVTYINQLLSDQNKITLELKYIENTLQEKYPNVIRNEIKPIDLNFLQQKLKNEGAVLQEYFMGEEALYVFTVSASSIEFRKIENVRSVRGDVLQLHDLFTDASAINNDIDRYKDLALKLFFELELPSGNVERNLVLIPDGLLSVIPFDALLYEKSGGTQYNTFPYLLKKYAIAYQPSAFIYANFKRSSLPKKETFLGMFPIFEKTDNELSYSKEEAKGIQKHMEGKFLYKGDATLEAFFENGNRYSIIHLSTHASTGDDALPPFITFIDSTLFLPKIYGLHLDTDLLVLSACETGVGLLVKGEGAISLARGFEFAGVQNIIFSLWRVNDYSTASLMVNFYKNYSESRSKTNAIQVAKLDYLSDKNISNDHKSPYYWAGFVYYGNLNTLSDSGSRYSSKVILLVVTLIVLACCALFFLNWKLNRW